MIDGEPGVAGSRSAIVTTDTRGLPSVLRHVTALGPVTVTLCFTGVSINPYLRGCAKATDNTFVW